MSNENCFTKVHCLECNTILISVHRHDFQMCGCSNQAFADGGSVYSRVGARDINKINTWDYVTNSWRKCGNKE